MAAVAAEASPHALDLGCVVCFFLFLVTSSLRKILLCWLESEHCKFYLLFIIYTSLSVVNCVCVIKYSSRSISKYYFKLKFNSIQFNSTQIGLLSLGFG